MKRIAALAAVTIGLLAIPAAAMASTITPGDPPGADYTSNVQVQPKECYVGWDKVHHHSQRYFDWWQDGRKFTALACPFPTQVSLPAPDPVPRAAPDLQRGPRQQRHDRGLRSTAVSHRGIHL